jgi:hypothetical protein
LFAETKSTKSDGVTTSKGETSRPSSKVARMSPSSRRNLVSQEELALTEAAKISGQPNDKDISSNHRKSGSKAITGVHLTILPLKSCPLPRYNLTIIKEESFHELYN